jgi:hypothetical protein
MFVRNSDGEMSPVSQYLTLTRVYGAESLTRFNLFSAISVNGAPADGYSSGQAIQVVREVAEQVLPAGYGFEFGGMSREESSTGNTTTLVFIISEQAIHFVRHSIMPWVVRWEQELNRKLFTDMERRAGYYVKFNLAGLLRGTAKERAEFYHYAITDGWMSRNEVRLLEDKNQKDGLDEMLVSVNASKLIGDKDKKTNDEVKDDPSNSNQ